MAKKGVKEFKGKNHNQTIGDNGKVLDGRIIKGVGGLYFIVTEDGLFKCKPRGIFRKNKVNPTIGDFVSIEVLGKDEGVINEIYKRETELIRPRVSNVNQVIIVFAATDPKINLDLLDRFILLAEEAGLSIVICINKVDLVNKEELEIIKELYEQIGYKIIFTSNEENIGIEKMKDTINNNTSVFAGPSGVGKSSLINTIFPMADMETGVLSAKIGRGKHTTRHAELIQLAENTYVVDSPGFTSLDLNNVTIEQLPTLFKEFRNHVNECKFGNCMHINEPECGVKNHLGQEISQTRYDRYIYLHNEISDRRK